MEKKNKLVFAAAALAFVFSTVFFLKASPSEAAAPGWIDEKQLGELCIGQIVPISDAMRESAEGGDSSISEETADKSAAEKQTEDENREGSEKASGESQEKVSVTGKPLVIIYHTHSTESYMPYKESNYHRESEEGTVRDVGSVLTEELKKNGINVVHDKTMHDRPSYNESYNRSLKTIEALKKKHPTAVYIIDLHRDAGSEGKYISIDGKRVAKFSMVVGTANDNYTELYSFAKNVSQTAEKQHRGFGGAIMEQDYKYNEYVSDRAMLLEIGNNKNTIEESRLCAVYFARALAEIIKSEQ